MAGYINPSTEVRILSVPWDEEQTNTMWWSYYSEQENYMIARTGKQFPINTYQRIQPGVFRAAIDADDLYGYNYLMFRNRQFPDSKYGEKWFYAFITEVEYVNDGMSNIHFKIDPIQTWFFETFGDDGESNIPTCWVKRIHQSTDEAGDNIQAEPLQLTDYQHEELQPIIIQTSINGQRIQYYLSRGPVTTDDPQYGYVAVVMVCDTSKSSSGTRYNGVYSGAILYGYPLTSAGINNIDDLISDYIEKPEAILGIYLCPTPIVARYLPSSGEGGRLNPSSEAVQMDAVFQNGDFSDSESFGTYIPKNKKCYTYPYNYFGVISPQGGSLILRYEFFKDYTPEGKIYGTMLDPVTVIFRPFDYGTTDVNYELQLTINNFPECSWNCDAFTSWVARNGVPILLNTVSDLAIPKNSENPLSQAQIAVGDVLSIASQTYTAAIAADIYKGNMDPGAADAATHTLEFYSARFYQPEDYIQYIDNYFTRYGYAQNKLMKPNMQARKYWTYIRTSNMDINADIPADAKKQIDNMFNSGFTAWNYDYISTKLSDYGNYSLENDCLG